uniref:CgeB family protein n=1 Tax=[Lactobacillus] rogosae TaxID=706562 RepID=UPI00402ACFD4
MNILFYRYGSICEPDIIASFKHLGFNITEDTREVYNKQLLPSDCIKGLNELLKQDTYSFIFSINFFPSVSDVCNIWGIPYLCLIVDSPVLELFSTSLANPCNKVFLFDRQLYNDFHHINPDGIFHIPLATNVRDNYATATMASAADRARFSSDISFIGSLYSEKCLYNQITLPEKMRGYVDGLIEAQLLVYGYNFIEECVTPELIEAFCKVRPELINFPDSMKVNTKAVIAQHIISVKVAEQERLRYLKALSEHFNVDLYTGSDTYSMPLIHNRGFAKTNTEMPIIFHQSKINLNLTAKSIRSGLSLRIFDVLGCEGFLITNYQAELPEHFNIGEDLEAYTSLDDLMGKCEYYLSHDKERREIAHNGFEKVKKYHTYDIRLTQMLEIAFGLK